jgi:predicted nucleotidyltransferase
MFPTAHVPQNMPEAVRAILTLLLTSQQRVLGGELVALYLYGSLSSGDFDPSSSDIDFLAVTRDVIREQDPMFERLREMHTEVAVSGLPFATHLEGSYIPHDALRHYNPADATHPTIGNDWPFMLGYHDINWVIERAIVRERGVVLWGPPPAMLIDPVSPQQLRRASCQQMTGHWRATIRDEQWLRPRRFSAFAVLTFCRALYTIEHGVYCSKPVAAAWTSQQYIAWQPMIAWALAHRADHSDTTPTELAATMTWLNNAMAEVERACGT